jgi:endonuclease/exonuclease/phosphatase family metal-dependent hydrolase
MHVTLCRGGDTLDLFLVHLLSKFSGAGFTADLRRIQARQLASAMDSVYALRREGFIMTMGDFNDEYFAYSMEPLRSARFKGDSLTPFQPDAAPGTYKYRGNWSQIDQVLVIQSSGVCAFEVNTLQLPPLFTEDLEYGGVKPKRTFEGYVYKGGVSDHLPLVVDLTFSPHRFFDGQ